MAVQQIYPVMSANPGDSLQIAAVKIVAWLSDLTTGMSVQQIYPVMTANPGDSPQISLVKAVAHLTALSGGGGVGGGLVFSTGSGSPEGVVVGSPGDTYWDTSLSLFYLKVTGTATNTGWEIH